MRTNDEIKAKITDLEERIAILENNVNMGFEGVLEICIGYDPDKRMSWRDVRDFLNGIADDEILDMDAAVWLYKDVDYGDGLVSISDLRPYDASEGPSKTNELSFTLCE